MTPYRLILDYTLHPGWMAPFVEGLAQGQAMARRCDTCARVSFPPVKTCSCGSAQAVWQQLPGTAQIIARTSGSDGDFALVHFDGADTQSTVRLQDLPTEAAQGILAPSTGELPQMILMSKGNA